MCWEEKKGKVLIMNKKSIAVILALLTAVSAVGCGRENTAAEEADAAQTAAAVQESKDLVKAGNDEANIRFSWWGPETRHTTTIAACELYQQDHPGVSFEYEYSDWNGYWDKMSAEAASNNLPDLMCQDYSVWESWINNEKLLDLTPYVESGALDLSNCDEAALASGYVNGKLYGIPCGVNCYTMIYNKKIAEEAGISLEPGYTWDDLAEYSKTVFDKTGVRTQCQDMQESPLLVEYHAREMGYSYVNEAKDGWGFPQEVLEEMLQWNYDIYNSGICIDINKARETNSYESNLITTGDQWYMPCWSNLFISYTSVSDEDLGLTVMPDWGRDKGQTEYSTYIKPSHFWTVTSDCENPDAVVEVINYLVNNVDANLIIKGERGVPINKEVRQAVSESLDDPNAVKVFELFDWIGDYTSEIDPPNPTYVQEASNLVISYFDAMLYGEMTPQETAEAIYTEGNSILSAGAANAQ